MKHIVDLAKNRGFVFQGSEIYGWLANSWDYGPLGSLMKENLKNLWIREFVQRRDDMVLLDASILMHPQVWVASGHVGGFSDPLIDNKDSKMRYRADKMIEEAKDINPDGFEVHKFKDYLLNKLIKERNLNWTIEEALNFDIYKDYFSGEMNVKNSKGEDIRIIAEEEPDYMEIYQHRNGGNFERFWSSNVPDEESYNKNVVASIVKMDLNKFMRWVMLRYISCPVSKTKNWTEIRNFNLMFKTFQWVTEDSSSMVYLRPETAQGIFVDFPNIVRTCRRRVPFGVAQVGKAFRNEITPGNFIFRTREFEQMEIEFFCEPGTQLEWHEKWKVDCKKFLMETVGIKEQNLRFRQHEKDELSHYSDATFDIEYDFPSIGFSELQGIASRTDFDLNAHMEESRQDMSYFDPVKNTKYVPFVIEPSIGLTRLFLATLCDAYDTTKDEAGEERIVLHLKPEVAPVKIAVLPLVKKLSEKAEEVFHLLSKHFMTWYDETGSIGKRYARFDEIGTPWCVTIDFDNTLEKNMVTIRDRDTSEQEIVEVEKLVEWFENKLRITN